MIFGIILQALLCTNAKVHALDSHRLESCENINSKNLSLLSGAWEVYMQSQPTTSYQINICSGFEDVEGCSGSAICRKDKKSSGDSYKSVGNFSTANVSVDDSGVGFYLEYKTDLSCGHDGQTITSTIMFDCGKTLGSPTLYSHDDCRHNFLWETYLACKHSRYDPLYGVRCSAHDENGKKHDLERIIKREGAYKAFNPSNDGTGQIYFNLCQDISMTNVKPDAALHSCPPGSAACLVQDGKAYSLGVPKHGVQMNGTDKLILIYVSDPSVEKPPSCSDYTPQITLTLICPGSNREGSREPLLTSSMNCQFDVVWWTEAACPEDFLRSTTCKLEAHQHGLNLDLTPLKKNEGRYLATAPEGLPKYWLNVCAPTQVACGDDVSGGKNAVCQVNSAHETPDKHKIAGSYQNHVIQYVDEELTLLYKNGDRCSNGLKRKSIIFFRCSETAGIGAPKFSHESHCTYYFDWETSNVCVSRPASCQLEDSKGLRYDLSRLTREMVQGNWQVLTGGADLTKRYFINVCSELLHSDGLPSSEDISGSSVSLLERDKFTSFGSYYNSSVSKKEGKILVTYRGGSSCAQGKRNRMTYLSLYCSPGDLESSPVMKYEPSDDECVLELKWHTAAACPLKSVTGKNCLISDETSGLTFDLKRLLKSGKDNVYNVSTANHNYYLNVCGPVLGTACGKTTVGVCQVEKGSARHWSLGEASDDLLYYDGFIKLTYRNGDMYSDEVHSRSVQFSFLCDAKVGAGSPVFSEEKNHTYVFKWYTSYVCQSTTVQCMVTDSSGDQYDLSGLAKSEDDTDANWSVLDASDATKRLKFYINVCRPVNEIWGHTASGAHEQNSCHPFTGACQTTLDGSGEEHVSIANLGVPSKPLEVQAKGHLVLIYSDGSACGNSQYSTKIDFVCSKGELSTAPRLVTKEECVMSFIWHTEAACPVGQAGAEKSCEVADPNSKFVYDLRPLQKPADKPYTFKGEDGYSYELNICGMASSCSGSSTTDYGGCRKGPDGKSVDKKVMNSSAPMFSDDGVLTLYYDSGSDESGRSTKYVISFICDRTITKDPQPSFSGADADKIRVDFPTHVACKPDVVSCFATDEFGYQYDLTRLANAKTYWDVEALDKSRHFYVAVCKPLPQLPNCPAWGNGACMVSSGNGTGLGLVKSSPTAVRESSTEADASSLSLIYDVGDLCVADPKRRYSTRILFFCSDEEGSPVHSDGDMDPCEFVFTWNTPVACKIRRTVSSANQSCAVTEPLYGMEFDLSDLKRANDYLVRGNMEWNFTINVCQKLQQGTGHCAESSSCQLNAENMHDSGKPNSTLVYEDGAVTLKYLHGQKCHKDKYERSTIIQFTCNHGDNPKETEIRYIEEKDDCTYVFDWQTPHVCPPIKIVGCGVTDTAKNLNYDLSSLSLPHKNFLAELAQDTKGRVYYLNVCRNLLHQPGVTCPPNSAVCVKTGKKFKNLGNVVAGPSLSVDGDLQILYTGGDVCNASKRYSTTVTFTCSSGSNVDPEPVVAISEDNGCHAEITWQTRAACPLDSKTEIGGKCMVENPVTGHTFDLSPLASKTYYEVTTADNTGRKFQINVCQPAREGSCSEDSAVCMIKNGVGTPAGKVTNSLTYTNGALKVTYVSGAPCEANSRYNHTSELSFVCHRSNSPALSRPGDGSKDQSKPVFISEDSATCTHFFSWHVFEACEVQTPCAVVDSTSFLPRIIDLSGLISESGHTTAISDVDQAVYFINICRSLEPIAGYQCPPGSAVCKTVSENSQGIGFMTQDVTPKLDPTTGSVSLEYKTSQSCGNIGYEEANVTSRVVITCLRGGGKGQPRLTTVSDDCTYLFEWATDVVCDESTPPAPGSSAPDSCSFTDEGGNVYDFSKLDKIQVKYDSTVLDVSICTPLDKPEKACTNSYVCLKKEGTAIGLGETRHFYDAPGEMAAMAVFTGGKCPESSGVVNATVLFTCSRTSIESNGVSVLHSSTDPCEYVVTWPTPYACPALKKSCTVTDPATDKEYDLSLLSSLSHSHKFKDENGDRYVLNLCQPIHSLTTLKGCKPDAAVCRFEDGKKVGSTIGILESQAMSVVKSKDSPTIEVHYSGGDMDVCGNNRFASTVIRFECGKSVHTLPTLEKFDLEKCVFYIKWISKIACPEEPEHVQIHESKYKDPVTGELIDLSALFSKSWTAVDMRGEPGGVRTYGYIVNLSGKPDFSVIPKRSYKCVNNTAVCQYSDEGFERVVGDMTMVQYVAADETLEVTFQSTDKCGKDSKKHSHSVISVRCSHSSGVGKPRFVYESNECGYFFEWYTNVMCVDVAPVTEGTGNESHGSDTNSVEATASPGTSTPTMMIVGVSVSAALCLCLAFLILRKPERRARVASKCRRCYWSCCGSLPSSRYRYSRVGGDEEDLSLLDGEQETSLLYSDGGPSALQYYDAPPLGGSMVESGADADLFGSPEVAIIGPNRSGRKSAGSRSKPLLNSSRDAATRTSVNVRKNGQSSGSLLNSVDRGGHGKTIELSETGELAQVPSRHVDDDDDDEDLLEL